MAFYYRNWPQERNYYVQRTFGGKLMVNHGLFARSALEAVGWVDEDRYQFYKADGDVCLKMWQAGYEIEDCPGAFVEHFESANRPCEGRTVSCSPTTAKRIVSAGKASFGSRTGRSCAIGSASLRRSTHGQPLPADDPGLVERMRWRARPDQRARPRVDRQLRALVTPGRTC